MSLLKPFVRRLLNVGGDTVIYECRDCGTALDGTEGPCPSCDSDSIACHTLE